MYVRAFYLFNNFYVDTEEVGMVFPSGEWSVWGHYDVMRVEKIEGADLEKCSRIIEEKRIEYIQGNSNLRVITCFPRDEDADQKIWDQDHSLYCFISLIRLRNREDVKKVLSDFPKAVYYDSLDHRDLISVYKFSSYIEGINYIEDVQKNATVYKMYTISMIKESELRELCEGTISIQEETVDVRLFMEMKDRQEAEHFISKIKDEFPSKDQKEFRIYYNVLGDNDVQVEIDNINIVELLRLYKSGNLLTHSNPRYRKAIFNVETKIMKHMEVAAVESGR